MAECAGRGAALGRRWYGPNQISCSSTMMSTPASSISADLCTVSKSIINLFTADDGNWGVSCLAKFVRVTSAPSLSLPIPIPVMHTQRWTVTSYIPVAPAEARAHVYGNLSLTRHGPLPPQGRRSCGCGCFLNGAVRWPLRTIGAPKTPFDRLRANGGMICQSAPGTARNSRPVKAPDSKYTSSLAHRPTLQPCRSSPRR